MSIDLSPYTDVVVMNAERIALQLAMRLKQCSLADQRAAFAGSELTGYFYLYRDESHPDAVMECVLSRDSDDAITSVYKNHSIFATPGELVGARERLIKMLAEKVGLSVEAIGIDDPGRGRSLNLRELATGQLIDLLAERMGQSIVTTDSHSVASLGVAL